MPVFVESRSALAGAGRLVLGSSLTVWPAQLQAALVKVTGKGWELRIELIAYGWVDLPENLLPSADQPFHPATDLHSQPALAELQAQLVLDLCSAVGLPPSQLLTVGVYDSGGWAFREQTPVGYWPLCDATRLAERTGLSVIDAFSARDLAQGGLGGPLLAMPTWFLLRHPHRNRLILELGGAFRLTYLPAGLDRDSLEQVLSFDVGPGWQLIDRLERQHAEALRNLPQPWTAAGHIRGTLIERWLAQPALHQPLPRWQSSGVSPVDFLKTAADHAAPAADQLRSALHFLAEAVRLARVNHLPPDPIDEVILTGPVRRHELLQEELKRCFGQVPLVPLDDLGLADPAFEPAQAALLAMFFLDQIPCNLPSVTGVDVPRVLGRLTPGAPSNWMRLVKELAESKGTLMSLRSALS